MVYLNYGFAGLFIVLSCAMLYAFYRSRNFGLFVMGLTYGASGLLAIAVTHWWPLVAGFILVWMLKLLGLEPRVEPTEGSPGEGTERQSQGTDKN